VELVAGGVDLHQAGGGDLLEHQTVRIDEELVVRARHARGDVREDEVVPLEQGDEPIGRGEVHARLPFGVAHIASAAADLKGLRAHVVSSSCSWTIGSTSAMMLSRQRQDMNTPVLTMPERQNIESGPWFSKLSLPLRNAILSRSIVRRMPDGALISSRGQPAEEWVG